MDGQSLAPLLLEGKRPVERGPIFARMALTSFYPAIHEERPKPYATDAVYSGDWKLLALEGKPTELFNLKRDPQERHNVVDEEAQVRDRLAAELRAWLQECQSRRR